MEPVYFNKYFYDYFLTCGNVRDNMIFENFPLQAFSAAKVNIGLTSNKNCRAVILNILRSEEKALEKTLEVCKSEYEVSVLSQHYFRCVLMLGILKTYNLDYAKGFSQQDLVRYIKNLTTGNLKQAKEDYRRGPCAYDINRLVQNLPKMELNIFCLNTENKHIQRAINDFIFARTPYAIKVFTNMPKHSRITSNGDLIENPHDFLTTNLNRFKLDGSEKE